jgi:hypothetical protein
MLRTFLGTLGFAAGILWYASSAASSAADPNTATPGAGAARCQGKECDELLPSGYKFGSDDEVSPGKKTSSSIKSKAQNLLAKIGLGNHAPRWVGALPADFTQSERTADERGVNPCWSPDPGFGDYGAWDYSPSIGQMLVPQKLELDADGKVPVMFHFHGHEPARKEWVQALDSAVLVALDLGINSGPYLRKFERPETFEVLVSSVEAALEKRLGEKLQIGKIGVSSWSAGYGAVQRVLESSMASRVDSVILLDGLHTSFTNTEGARLTMAPFVRFAQRATAGETFMHVSHSSILPPGYASTTETANYLIWQVGGEPEERSARSGDPMGLKLFRGYDSANFHVEGYSGNGKLDHCAQLGVYREVLRDHVAERWGLSKVN